MRLQKYFTWFFLVQSSQVNRHNQRTRLHQNYSIFVGKMLGKSKKIGHGKKKEPFVADRGPQRKKITIHLPGKSNTVSSLGQYLLFCLFAYLLIKRDTGPRMVPQSDSHKKLNRQNRKRDLRIKNATLEIFEVFPLIATGKHTRSKNPTTSKLFHSRPKLRYPVWFSISYQWEVAKKK